MKLKTEFRIVACTSFAQAHVRGVNHKHDHTPKPVIAEKVTTENGTFTYVADAKFGKFNGQHIGSSHGGKVVDSARLTLCQLLMGYHSIKMVISTSRTGMLQAESLSLY